MTIRYYFISKVIITMVIGDKLAGESWLNKPLAPYIDNTLGLKEKKNRQKKSQYIRKWFEPTSSIP